MPGFEFRYRRDGGQPTIRNLPFEKTGRLTRGDFLNFAAAGGVTAAVQADSALVGLALETLDGEARVTTIRLIADADAVYAVEDPYARTRGDLLHLVGGTGAQGVASSAHSELIVEADCTADEVTLVTINVRAYHDLEAPAVRRRPTGGDLNAAIARAVVRYYREHTGRGPTRAHAFYRGEVIVVVLEDTMTKAERSLVNSGRQDAVLHLREALQETMRADMVGTVEALTDRTVRAFLSANHLDPDIAVETFVLDRAVEPAHEVSEGAS